MSILGAFPLTAQSRPLSPSNNSSAISRIDKGFFEFNGKTVYLNLNCEADYLEAYRSSSSLKAVINRRAQYFVNGKYKVLNDNTDTPLRGEQAKRINGLLERPNILQTGRQFKAQHDIYIDIFGYCPVIKFAPVGFPLDVYAMWNLPPWLFDVTFKKVKFWELGPKAKRSEIYESFSVNWEGAKRTLDMESVFIVLDNTISTDSDGNIHLPDSRIKGLEYDISNEIASKQANNTLLTKKGAIGILSGVPPTGTYVPIKDDKERQRIQDDFKRYGLTGQEWQVIITDAALNWQSMAMSPTELGVFETMTASQAAICDGMGMYQYIMANGGKSTTFTNLNEAKKSQYQDFIIPDDDSRTEQLSEGIIPTEDKGYITVDYSHVECLQESEKAKADTMKAKADGYQAFYDLGLLTRNDMRKMEGMPMITGKPEMDQYSFEQKQVVDPNAPPPGDPTKKPVV
jgi:hypothetical protein